MVESNIYNVSGFLAKGDGKNDDTTPIQNAINAARTDGGGIVYFPIGVYRITAPLIGYSNIWYLGAASSQKYGGGACIRQTVNNLDALRFNNTTDEITNVVISNLRIEGPGITTGNGIYLKNSGLNGNHPPFTYFSFRDLYIAEFNGIGACGVNMEGAIVSKLERVVSETCTTGFYSNGRAAGGALWSTTATSLNFDTCYADGCQLGSGFKLDCTVYTSLNNCAADSCGIAYQLSNCNAVSLSGCGCEYGAPDTSTPGIGFKLSGCNQITLSSPYVFQNKNVGFWVTGGSRGITMISPQENTPVKAKYSDQIDAGSKAVIISAGFTSPSSEAIGAVTRLG